MQFFSLFDDRLGTAHHLHEKRGRIIRRQGNQVGRVAVPMAEVSVDDTSSIVLGCSMVGPVEPAVLQALRYMVLVVDLVQGDTLVDQMQHAVVKVRVGVSLPSHDLLDPIIPPSRPGVGREHDFRFLPVQIQGFVDIFRPVQGVPNHGAPQRIDVVDCGCDIFGGPEGLHVREIGVHLAGSFRIRRVLEDHLHTVDGHLLDVVLDDHVGSNQAQVTGGRILPYGLVDMAIGIGRKQHTVLKEHSPVHGITGIHVLGNRMIHESIRGDDLDLAADDVL